MTAVNTDLHDQYCAYVLDERKAGRTPIGYLEWLENVKKAVAVQVHEIKYPHIRQTKSIVSSLFRRITEW